MSSSPEHGRNESESYLDQARHLVDPHGSISGMIMDFYVTQGDVEAGIDPNHDPDRIAAYVINSAALPNAIQRVQEADAAAVAAMAVLLSAIDAAQRIRASLEDEALQLIKQERQLADAPEITTEDIAHLDQDGKS